MSHARKAALHLLSSDWSRGVWKQWLSNIFLPPVEPPRASPPVVAVDPTPRPATVSAPENVTRGKLNVSCGGSRSGASSEAKASSATEYAFSAASAAREEQAVDDKSSEAPESTNAREVRRSELRARFDAISDRLISLEDGLETLLRRSAQRDKLERRADQQSVEVIDNVALAGERQAAVLEGLLSTVARLEHAVSRLEAGLVRVERAVGERPRRESHFPTGPALSQPPRNSASHFPESHHAQRDHAPRDRAPLSTRGLEWEEADVGEGAGINGYLSDMSLSTVMAMLEIERHTGRLKVATDDGLLASFELSEGSVVSSRLSENDADPLQTLRTALCWKQGRFWFRQQPAEAPSSPPRSIGSLLLEATRQNDESFADVG